MDNSAAEALIGCIHADRDQILDRISISGLKRYLTLQESLQKGGTLSDDYKTTFRGYYRVRRNASWSDVYFDLLQTCKDSGKASFKEVLEYLYLHTSRVEPSFASKLVATIAADKPVYDSYVRSNLCLVVPPQYKPAQERILGFVRAYGDLDASMHVLLSQSGFRRLREDFLIKFQADPALMNLENRITDLKILDLLLWQMR